MMIKKSKTTECTKCTEGHCRVVSNFVFVHFVHSVVNLNQP